MIHGVTKFDPRDIYYIIKSGTLSVHANTAIFAQKRELLIVNDERLQCLPCMGLNI